MKTAWIGRVRFNWIFSRAVADLNLRESEEAITETMSELTGHGLYTHGFTTPENR